MDDQANEVEGQWARRSEGKRPAQWRSGAAVLRLLRGEYLETVSRELGVTAATLTG